MSKWSYFDSVASESADKLLKEGKIKGASLQGAYVVIKAFLESGVAKITPEKVEADAASMVTKMGYTGEKAKDAQKRLARLLKKNPTADELRSLASRRPQEDP